LLLLLLVPILAGVAYLWFSLWFVDARPFATTIAKADKVILWEGLPHPSYEKGIYRQEAQSRKTVTIHEALFYPEPLELKPKDIVAIAEIFQDGESFRPLKWFTSKTCGGFHPDYLLEWETDEADSQALICFGCNEIKAFAPWTRIHAEITDEARGKLKRILRSYRKNRPKTGQPAYDFAD
jgi:hypothetical protein